MHYWLTTEQGVSVNFCSLAYMCKVMPFVWFVHLVGAWQMRHTLQSLSAVSKQHNNLMRSCFWHWELFVSTLNESEPQCTKLLSLLRPDILITDLINREHAHPNLSGLLQRLRADQQLVLESRCLSIINTPQSGLISFSDMLHRHFSTPSGITSENVDSNYGLPPFSNKPTVSLAQQQSKILNLAK